MTEEEKWSLPTVLAGIEQLALRVSRNPEGHPFDRSNAGGIVDIVREFRDRQRQHDKEDMR
jgi:hypothetical protein